MSGACDTGLAASWRAAPNFNERSGGKSASILLLHYTGMETAQAALDHLCHTDSGVSCHYLIDEQGAITQMVSESARAWHAGQSFWAGETDVNSASIGIEIVNRGHDISYDPFPAPQIEAVIALGRDIASRNNIYPRHILAHSDVAPGRKQDPGEKFPWPQLHEQGVGHFVEPVPIENDNERGFGAGDRDDKIALARQLFSAYGYQAGSGSLMDEQTCKIVTAFQRHFRPQKVDGQLDLSTLKTAQKLMAALAKEPVA